MSNELALVVAARRLQEARAALALFRIRPQQITGRATKGRELLEALKAASDELDAVLALYGVGQ